MLLAKAARLPPGSAGRWVLSGTEASATCAGAVPVASALAPAKQLPVAASNILTGGAQIGDLRAFGRSGWMHGGLVRVGKKKPTARARPPETMV